MRRIFIMIIAATVIGIFGGCGKTEDAGTSEILGYSDEIAENILQGINQDSYEKYTWYFDEKLKNAISQSDFLQGSAILKSKVGMYISKSFYKTEMENGNIAAYYKARFSNESEEVIIKITLKEINGSDYVSEITMDSPKLRE